MARQLLAFGRRQTLQREVLDLNGVCKRLEPMLRGLVSEDIEVVTEFEPRLDLVWADPHQLDQKILNLVMNAWDALGKNGRIVIRTENVSGTRVPPRGRTVGWRSTSSIRAMV